MKKLTEKEISEELNKMKGWSLKGNVIEKTFLFHDFKEAVNFLNKVQPIADSMNHHPDVCIYYNKVIVQLTTHDAGGITDLDVELAKKIDELLT
ncbi:4a-hydroxytetrahydrobiopterin dehydratase [Sulfurisphaera ohwakuensis]|uniref:Putative pterin-4-alpha-carbinolamine dehydratase n=1 Tax=Sulfurisphaera ohwakuensis TaxID=69656 RepID=A0A650CJ83_SULOH|nr:4a-hydroxytetrahydrobiopterin dehydratase [Sulfurisphaera ohwakuensis]MBB5253482.1 4a-hydroxytetrahydrobiopterin dehydratase [Sulfurisphaera ohwakuensis]QGR17788.1 4a-hydroxytetrahydrobiopterin dehydratase [Sulfurisphaera ohwakuensis]